MAAICSARRDRLGTGFEQPVEGLLHCVGRRPSRPGSDRASADRRPSAAALRLPNSRFARPRAPRSATPPGRRRRRSPVGTWRTRSRTTCRKACRLACEPGDRVVPAGIDGAAGGVAVGQLVAGRPAGPPAGIARRRPDRAARGRCRRVAGGRAIRPAALPGPRRVCASASGCRPSRPRQPLNAQGGPGAGGPSGPPPETPAASAPPGPAVLVRTGEIGRRHGGGDALP